MSEESPTARRQDSGAVVMLLTIALLLLLSYIGGYVALADNTGPLRMQEDERCYRCSYRCGGKVAEFVFWPLHQVDQKLRPDYWAG